jgi:hypothetical protein
MAEYNPNTLTSLLLNNILMLKMEYVWSYAFVAFRMKTSVFWFVMQREVVWYWRFGTI